MARIDSHQHFWKYNPVRDAWISDEMNVIQRDFLPQDLAPLLQQAHIDGCVSVQADQSEDETTFLLSLADQHAFVKGVVGWVDLRSANLVERLDYFHRFKKLVGFRHIVQGEKPGFMLQEKFIDGVKQLSGFGFTYDLLLYHHQLEEALAFIQKTDGQKIVIDHLAKPDIRNHDIKAWEKHIRAIAGFDQVYCKVSGMVTEAEWKGWKVGDFTPYLDVVFDAFGTDRLMYGSDWPVCLLAAGYDRQYQLVWRYLEKLSVREKNKVLGGNAIKFYNLEA